MNKTSNSALPLKTQNIFRVHIKSLALHPQDNSFLSSIKILSPYVHKYLEVFHFMIQDIVQATLHGITSMDSYRKQILIFMDFLCFTADYFASSPMIDVSSHAAICPFTCCTFEPKKNNCGSTYAYSKIINSRRPTYIRTSQGTLS